MQADRRSQARRKISSHLLLRQWCQDRFHSAIGGRRMKPPLFGAANWFEAQARSLAARRQTMVLPSELIATHLTSLHDRAKSHLRQLPWCAAFAVEPAVVAVLADEAPALRVPAQALMIPVGEVAEVADGDRAGADLDVRDRIATRADAVEPVALMAGRAVETHIFVADGDFDDLGGLAGEEAAIDVDGAVGTGEEHAACARAVNDFDAAGVEVADAGRRLGIFRRDDLGRAGLIHAQPPLRDVEMVRAPVGHHAAGVFLVLPPVGEVL